MRKTILALSAVGLGAGLVYAFSSKNGECDAVETKGNAEEHDCSDRISVSEPEQAQPPTGKIENDRVIELKDEAQPEIDDRGTNQSEAANILRTIRDSGFESDNQKLALALGRPSEEIQDWLNGSDIIDGDVVMKARELASERGIQLE